MTTHSNRLVEKLKDKDFKLNAMLEVTMAINNNVSVADLLQLYERILHGDLGIEKLLLFSKEDSWTCMLKFGVEGEVGDITNEEFFNDSDSIQVSISEHADSESFDVVIPVYHDEAPIAYVLVGDLEEDQIKMSPVIRHMKYIQTITNVIIVAIRNRRFAEENVRQERVKKELELAAEMQAILVPQILPKNELFEVAAVYRPHQQVGGDYYDIMELENGKYMMCMGDVSGKGVSAAFLMANFQAYLRAIFTYKNLELKEVIHELNQRVMHSAMGEKYITFFIAVFDPKSRNLEYINCGHNPPVICFNDGSTDLLTLGSIGLGMFEEIPSIQMGTINVDPGTSIICYTDGLVEIENADKEEYGVDRLRRVISASHQDGMASLNELIIETVTAFKGDMPFVDDTALLSYCFR